MGKYLRPFLLLSVATLTFLAGETAALAQRGYYGPGYGPRPGYYVPRAGGHAHDGFYMRLDAGLGYLTASETYTGVTDEYSGIGATYGAAFGGAIAPNLILFGELFGTTVINADVTWEGYTEPSGFDLTMYGFGPGIAYYFQPSNLYLSGSLAFSRISFSYTDTDYYDVDDSKLGLGLNLMVGKEWWVARDWGIGIAGQVHLARMSAYVEGYDSRINAMTMSLLFSATYN